MNVRVLVDFANPASYLAVEPARALESRLGRTFPWLPFQGPALLQRFAATADEDRAARHRRIRGDYLAADLLRYAQARGLDIGDPCRRVDAGVASLGLLWLDAREPRLARDYVVDVFHRIWCEHGVADLAFVEAALGRAATGFAAYCESVGPGELASLRAEMQALGTWMAPAFVVGDEPFIGRQHIPIVEWLLTGR